MKASTLADPAGRSLGAHWSLKFLAGAMLVGALLAGPTAADPRWIPRGPDGGAVEAVFASPSQADTVYAGMAHGGVSRSLDGGLTWTRFSQGMTVAQVRDFAEGADGTLYAATRRGIYRRGPGSPAWARASNGLPEPFAYAQEIMADPSQPHRLYALIAAGVTSGSQLWASNDGGEFWEEVHGAFFPTAIAFLATTPATLIVANGIGVRVLNETNTWDTFSAGLPQFPQPLDLEAHPSDPSIVFALVHDPVVPTNLPYRSDDGGRTWRAVGEGLPDEFVIAFRAEDANLEIDPQDPETLYLGTYLGVFRSDDGAASWYPIQSAPGNVASSGLVALGNDRLVVGTPPLSGVLRSNDGGASWRRLQSGFLGRQIHEVSPDPVGPGRVVAASEEGLLVSDDDGQTWQVPEGGESVDASALLRDPNHPSNLFAVSGNRLLRSLDGGSSWAHHGPEFEDTVRSLAWDATGDILYRTTAGALWSSTDEGLTWSDVSGTLCERPLYLAPPSDEGILLVGCTGRLTLQGAAQAASETAAQAANHPKDFPTFPASLLRSFDGGQTWGVVLDDLVIFGGAWSFGTGGRPGRIFASLNEPGRGRTWRSLDSGATWDPLDDLQLRRVQSLTVDPRDDGRILAGTFDYGVLESLNGGIAWHALGEGLESSRIESLEFDARDGRVWAGTGAGVHVYEDAPSPPHCTSGGQVLCLLDRFQVQVEWTDFEGNSGVGTAVPITAKTGAFWFFGPGNLEFALKILDGRELNDHFWLFYGGLSTVQYTVRATDLVTGITRVVENTSGSLVGGANTSAFLDLPGSSGLSSGGSSGDSMVEPDRAPTSTEPSLDKGNDTTLRLQDGRFEVEVFWRTPDGNSGMGRFARLAEDTGTFHFFHHENLEVFVKILDGRSLNDHYWLFFTALSDVAYDLVVTDTQTDESRTYSNQQGNFGGLVDLELF